VFSRPPAPSDTLLSGYPVVTAFARLSRGDVRTTGRDQPHARRRADSSVSSGDGQGSSANGSGGHCQGSGSGSGSGSDDNHGSYEGGHAKEEANTALRTDTDDSDGGAGGLVHGDTPEDISLSAAIKDINALRVEAGLATELEISTMTVVVMLNYRVKLAQLVDHYEEVGLTGYGFEMAQGGRRFSNCVTLLGKGVVPPSHGGASAGAGTDPGDYDSERSKGAASLAIKIFSNGNVHLAGVRTVRTALDYATLVCAMLDRLRERGSNHHGASSAARVYRIASWNVTLINAYFRLALPQGSTIDLGKLQEAVMRYTPHYVVVNSDAHAGATIRMLYEGVQRISVMVFESGNVLISAFINAPQLRAAYNFVTGFVKTHSEAIIRSGGGPSTANKAGGAADAPSRHSKRRRLASGAGAGVSTSASGFDYGRFMVLK
jgi:hypothetical protein